MTKPLLSVKNLTVQIKSYEKSFPVVKEISLDLYAKETIAIVGESGSGKSIFAKTLLRLNPKENSYVSLGSIHYNDEDLLSCCKSKMNQILRKEIAIIFQDPLASLNPTMKIGKQIRECVYLQNPNYSKNEAVAKVLSLLCLVGIPLPEDRYHQYPHELSGGMRQRVMIAMALAREPKILIADEPTTALDCTIQEQIIALLEDLKNKFNMSILFITHDLSLAARFADRIAVMYNGRIIEEATSAELFTNPTHPYTQKLLQSIPRMDGDPNQELIPIQGSPPTIYEEISGCSFYNRCPLAKPVCRNTLPLLESCRNSHKCACLQTKIYYENALT